MTRYLCLLLLSFAIIACESPTSAPDSSTEPSGFELPEKLSSSRIQFALELKQRAGMRCWPGFAEKAVEGPFIYFQGDTSEIFFPDSLILQRVKGIQAFSADYAVAPRTDTIPYHFELMISLDEADRDGIHFEHPVQQFISVEEISQFIPPVSTTEMWTTMVIHEMFHHFQYNQPAFMDYGKKIASLGIDIRNLTGWMHERQDFKDGVRRENGLVMEAIAAANDSIRFERIQDYLGARKERMATFGDSAQLVRQVEDFYLMQEGSARYVEFNAMQELEGWKTAQLDSALQGDPRYNQLMEFEQVDLEARDFDYLTYTDPSVYHYALGFNLIRLMELSGYNYTDFLEQPEIPLDQRIASIPTGDYSAWAMKEESN